MREIENLKKELTGAQKALRDKQDEIAALRAKRGKISDPDTHKAREISDARAHRQAVLGNFATGKASRGDVDRATEALAVIEKERDLDLEMMGAIEGALKKAEADLAILRNNVEMARRAILESLYAKFKKQAQEAVGDLHLLAIAAKSRCGGWGYQEALLDIFGGGGQVPSLPHPTVVEEAVHRITAEYGIDL